MKKSYFILLLVACCASVGSYANDTLRINIDAGRNCDLVIGPGDGSPVDTVNNPLQVSGNAITVIVARAGFTGAVLLRSGPVEEKQLTNATNIFTADDPFFKDGSVIAVVIGGQNKCWFKTKNSAPKVVSVTSHKIGSMVYDALYLQHHPNDDNKFKILAYYAGMTSGGSVEQLVDNYADNEFIDKFRIRTWVEGNERSAGGNYKLNLQGLTSSIGGLDVTTVADGLAKFIVQRTKEELNLAFFDKFSKALEETPDLKTLFPETYTTLRIIGDEVYNYQSYLETLRENFQNDLNTLPEHLPGVIVNHEAYFKGHPELEVAVRSSSYFATSIRDNVHPGHMIRDMPVGDYFSVLRNKNMNWEAALKATQLFSESLRDTSTGENASYWVSNEKINELLHDTAALKIFVGLFYQTALTKYDGIKIQKKVNSDIKVFKLTDLINEINASSEYINNVSGFVQQFSQRTNKLNQLVKAHKKPENDSVAVELYASYFNASINLLELSKDAYKLVPLSRKDVADTVKKLAQELEPYFEIAGSTSKMVVNLNRRKYPAAVANAANIIYLIYDVRHVNQSLQAYDDSIKGLREQKKSAAGRDKKREYKVQIKAVKKDKDSLNNSIGFTQTFLKYGTFMGTIVQAQNSDEAADAIETFALPPGSSRIKRETPFNVSVNAYCGGFIGIEDIIGVNTEKTGVNSYGLTAPVGFAVSTGKKKFLCMPYRKKGHWSYSLFVSVIDIGAVAAFRFANDTTETVPTIQLKNILSPGAFVSIGIPKTPISLNGGVQVGPSLRQVKSSTIDISDNIYVRYSFSVNVDIPILNLYTKSY